jgi:hypothetical protein
MKIVFYTAKRSIMLLFVLLFYKGVAQETNLLRTGFQNPPHSAKPVVWWHWVGNNVTKEGITKDLEWMKRTGIGGFQAFDVSIGGGQTVEKKIKYMTPEWFELIKHTAAEADRLGLEMTMVTAAGWSETGGTWVKPHEAMKKLVWSRLNIVGRKTFKGVLPKPPVTSGPIRNLPKRTNLATDPTYYADQKVLAYKTPENELVTNTPKIINHKGETVDAKSLLDDDLLSKVTLETPKSDQPVYLQFEYEKPFTTRSFSFALLGAGNYHSTYMRAGYVQVSDDGITFKTLFSLPGPQHDIRAVPVRTFAFPETTAKFYRVVFTTGGGNTTVGGPDDFGGFRQPASPPVSFDISEAIFSSEAKINRWEDKANYAPLFAFEGLKTPQVPQQTVIKSQEVIDLTSKMQPDGTLEWEVPAGNWTILRLGQSLTGAKNGPTMPDAVGFEVDKLSKTHLESYMSQWSNPIAKAMGEHFGKGLKYFLVDSYEADAQNWTESFIQEFITRRGYDPTHFLPALTGKIVESAEVSDRFLWDYRLTFAELLVDNHYAAITDFAHKQGIKTYGEVAGISMPIIQDALRTKNAVDIPMGEFGMGRGLGSDRNWISPFDLEAQKAYGGANERLNAHQSDVREAASAAHVYGKKIVAAEAWTGGGYEAPMDMKFIGDYWLSQGINQIIFHTSAHQPLDTKPGNTMVGTHFHRNITWAEQAKPFVDYISRNQFMLQQGRSIADIAYYLGEDIPAVVPYWEKLKNEAPEGYDYDFVNTEILHQFVVEDGELTLPSGMRYKVLVLPEKNTMTMKVLTKITELVKAGANIVGPKPEKSPSLIGYPSIDREIALQANEVWGQADGQYMYQYSYGKGKVFWNAPLQGILGQLNVEKDVNYIKPHTDTRLSWIHRKTADADYYFVLNMRNHPEDLAITFRISDRTPELWRADKGTVEPVSYKMEKGLTTVKLHFEAQESVFVVFQKTASQTESTVSERKIHDSQKIEGAWALSFPDNWGAPKQVTLNNLLSWSNHPDEGVKYFSGTATYSKEIEIKKEWKKPDAAILLDLGTVKDIAVVSVNGIEIDTLWKAPYQVDISKAAKVGKNKLEIKVTNQWDNRIAGDSKLPKEQKILQIASGGIRFGGDPKPKESGLLGPVVLRSK